MDWEYHHPPNHIDAHWFTVMLTLDQMLLWHMPPSHMGSQSRRYRYEPNHVVLRKRRERKAKSPSDFGGGGCGAKQQSSLHQDEKQTNLLFYSRLFFNPLSIKSLSVRSLLWDSRSVCCFLRWFLLPGAVFFFRPFSWARPVPAGHCWFFVFFEFGSGVSTCLVVPLSHPFAFG